MARDSEKLRYQFNTLKMHLHFEYFTWLILKDRSRAHHLAFAQRAFSFENQPFIELSIETESITAGCRKIARPNGLVDDDLVGLMNEPQGVYEALSLVPGADPGGSWNNYFEPIGLARYRGQRQWPAMTRKRSYETIPEFPEEWELDQELVCAPQPFAGLGDLMAQLNIPMNPPNARFEQVIELIVVPPVKFAAETSLMANVLTISIEAASSAEPTLIAVGARTEIIGRPFERRRLQNLELISKDTGVSRYRIQEKFDQSVSSLLFLTYEGRLCERLLVRDPRKFQNKHLFLNRIIDPENQLSAVIARGTGRDFEAAVGCLFSMLGFSILPYGGIKDFEEGTPDIIALSTDGHVLLLECTVGDIDNKGKIHKFNSRTKAIKQALEGAQGTFNGVQSAIVTNLTRAETAVHHDKLRAFGIAVICRENLEQITMALENSMQGRALYEAIVGMIPTASVVPPQGQLNLGIPT